MASYCPYDKRRNLMVISDFFKIVNCHMLWQWKIFLIKIWEVRTLDKLIICSSHQIWKEQKTTTIFKN